jgi:hypothetical protein
MNSSKADERPPEATGPQNVREVKYSEVGGRKSIHTNIQA